MVCLPNRLLGVHRMTASQQLESDLLAQSQQSTSAARFLRNATALWFAVAFIGQWAFMYYLIAFYGQSIVIGDLGKL